MNLLSQLQRAVANALESLSGRQTKGLADLYYVYASRHINIAADGFLLLRRERRVDGARLLVRPALEAMLRLRAVHAKPFLLYRVSLAEALETDKWLGGIAKRHRFSYTRVSEREEWRDFKARCASEFGHEKLENTPLSSYDAAAAIGLEAYYESHYRAYCQYTHGALEAVSGNFDEITDPEDTRVMLSCAISALEVLLDLGADCQEIDVLRQRFLDLTKEEPQKLFRYQPN